MDGDKRTGGIAQGLAAGQLTGVRRRPLRLRHPHRQKAAARRIPLCAATEVFIQGAVAARR